MKNQGSISRRDFLKETTLAATAVTTGLARNSATGQTATPAPQGAPAQTMVGFQAEVSYLMQYGIVRFLDDVQTRANVNTLMLHADPFEPSWAGLDLSLIHI